jgi:hypothetical protein
VSRPPSRSFQSSRSVRTPPTSSKRSRYSSAYAPQDSTDPPLTYDSYTFRRTSFLVDAYGNVSRVYGTSVETILVAKDWRRKVDLVVPEGGYLGSGCWKYAFRVRFYISLLITRDTQLFQQGLVGQQHLAVFQIKHQPGSAPEDSAVFLAEGREKEIEQDHMDEGRALSLISYFLKSFYRRANAEGIEDLPGV